MTMRSALYFLATDKTAGPGEPTSKTLLTSMFWEWIWRIRVEDTSSSFFHVQCDLFRYIAAGIGIWSKLEMTDTILAT